MVARQRFAGRAIGKEVWVIRSTTVMPSGNVETYSSFASGESAIPFANSNRPGSFVRSAERDARCQTAPAGVSVRYISPAGAIARSLNLWPAPATACLRTSRVDARSYWTSADSLSELLKSQSELPCALRPSTVPSAPTNWVQIPEVEQRTTFP